MNKKTLASRLPVVGSIATMPSRIGTFSQMLPSALEQVDWLYVYLDGFKKIPEALLKHPKCRPVLLDENDSLHASSRFLAGSQFGSDAIIALFDDDISYPSDYVEKIKNGLEKYGTDSIVGFHGGIFRPPHISYVRDRISYPFDHILPQDLEVHILGAGTAAYLSSVFKPVPVRWRHRNMADLYLAAEALKSGLRLLALRRESAWLKPLAQNQDDSIWKTVQKDDRIHSAFMVDLLSQHSMTRWKSWWKYSDELAPEIKSSTQNAASKPALAGDQTIKTELLLNHEMEKFMPSTAQDAERLKPFAVGERKRYATCSGVSWISEKLLASVNLYGQHLRVHEFGVGENKDALTLLLEVSDGMDFPESVSISPDRKTMAVSHTMSHRKGLSLHRVECESGFRIARSRDVRKGPYHSLCFSPNSRFLVATEIGSVGFVEVINASTGQTSFLRNGRLYPLRPKSVAISPDGNYLVIVSGFVVKPVNTESKTYSVISIHRFCQQEGKYEENPITELQYSNGKHVSIEDSSILSKVGENDEFILASVDQANDQILAFACNTSRPKIRYLGPIAEGMSFPHGIDVSPDGKYIAVANYGDNSIKILSCHHIIP